MINALEYCLRWTPEYDKHYEAPQLSPGLTARVLPLLGVPHHPDLRGGPSHVRPPQSDVITVAEDDMEDEEGDSQDDGAHPDVFLLPRLSV